MTAERKSQKKQRKMLKRALQRLTVDYLSRATVLRRFCTPAQIRAAAKMMVNGGRIPEAVARVARSLREEALAA